jgi:CBS domain-containing protein
MKVLEIMTTKVESVSPTTSLRIAARKMKELNIGSMMVMDGAKLLGIITDRDLSVYAIAMGHDPQSTEVQKVMTSEVFTCAESQNIDVAAKIMEEHHIRRLAVTDGNNAMAGFLSVDDLAHVSHELAGVVLEAATPIH